MGNKPRRRFSRLELTNKETDGDLIGVTGGDYNPARPKSNENRQTTLQGDPRIKGAKLDHVLLRISIGK